jgi:hypothetical protein
LPVIDSDKSSSDPPQQVSYITPKEMRFTNNFAHYRMEKSKGPDRICNNPLIVKRNFLSGVSCHEGAKSSPVTRF